MPATPALPRHSAAGNATGIPTPGRSRASSTTAQQSALQTDGEYISRAFAEAIKANDPAQHRAINTTGASLSPQSSSIAGIQSGRRSVAGRSSSSASANAQSNRSVERAAKTPVAARPPSRHSDVFAKSTTRPFVVGDQVRMESLGFEGTLKFLGEIDGKPGLWAGVELSGGFAGKGKNNGTANGVRYFDCADKCGVFIAAFKLSAPTVGPGAVSRPSSVTSLRGGRLTPANSGRITPSNFSTISGRASTSSLSTGRVTPSTSGRITPISTGRTTPAVTPAPRNRLTLGKSINTKVQKTPTANQFSAGSRASKLVSMTARQLSTRDELSASPTRRALESPTRSLSSPSSHTLGMASPTRITGSPFNTPKSGIASRASSSLGGGLPTPNKSRSSLSTPRPRIPSAVAMPPPASPVSARSTPFSMNHLDSPSIDDLERVPYKRDATNSLVLDPSTTTSSIRSESVSSIRSLAADNQLLMDQLQSRINALEYDNERLRMIPVSNPDERTELQAVERERDEASDKISTLESALVAAKGDIESHQIRLVSLEQAKQEAIDMLEAQILSATNGSKALQEELATEQAVVLELRSSVERTIEENKAVVSTKEDIISSLQLKLAATSAELREEQFELNAQIEKLRTAGQETIALYEERLSEADGQRYELEHRIASLETRIQNAQKVAPPPVASTDSAAEIDNQTLRDQVHHLQHKISMMEDSIEDMQAAAERDEVAMRERMHRLKEKEDVTRKELAEGRKEVERLLKSETIAKNRVEEIEEALRESTLALESARAEVEGLRAELANLDSLVADSTGADLFSRVAEAAQTAANDKVRYMTEIAQLKETLEDYRGRRANDTRVSQLTEEKTLLQEQLEDQRTKLGALSESLDSTSRELEALKKKSNRDVTVVNSGLHEMPRPSPTLSPKHDLSIARGEITGLKHIVQELQKENLVATQRVKILESENQLLLSEASQLRQEVQILEENLDSSLEQEENLAKGPRRTDESPRKLKEHKSDVEDIGTERELRKRLADVEMKNARTVHDLNKEISELEALVESKIYREDELEQEVERMRDKLARYDKKRNKGSSGAPEAKKTETEPVCEICEKPGHDIFGCDVLNKDALGNKELFCEDCESHGHTSADCPHSLDVF